MAIIKDIRITPLNISCAVLAAVTVGKILLENGSWKESLWGALLLLILVISDLFFRLFFSSLKRIWIVELGFILFTILVIWIVRKN